VRGGEGEADSVGGNNATATGTGRDSDGVVIVVFIVIVGCLPRRIVPLDLKVAVALLEISLAEGWFNIVDQCFLNEPRPIDH